MKDKLRQIGAQHLKYILKKWKKNGGFSILNVIGENFTMVQLMDTIVNVNNYISTVVYWIFDSNN